MKDNLKADSTNIEKVIRVKVLNDPSGGYEKFFRMATGNNTGSLLRSAYLKYNSNDIELGFLDDLGNYKLISKLHFSDILVVKHRPNAISLMNQLLKPALKGFGIGFGIVLISLFSGKLAIGGLGIFGLIAFTTIFWSIGALIKLEEISIVVIECSDSKGMEFALNSKGFKAFSEILKEKSISIEYYNKPTITESDLTLLNNPKIENEILRLNMLVDMQKKKGIFGKDNKNEICQLIQDICISKNDAQYIINEYYRKFNSNLIEDLMKLSSSYDSKKEFIRAFIDLNIVEKDYPHVLKV